MTSRLHHLAARSFALGLLVLCIGSPALAATPRVQLQRDRAACQRIPAGDAHQNCLSEANTAFARSRPSAVDEDPASLLRNSTRRCEVLPEIDRRYCMDRMGGAGTTSGSVSGGGILRELRSIEPAAPPAAAEAK